MDTIRARRSIRKYTGEPVSDAAVRELLEAAMSAPSARNEQPWHFIVIKDRAILDEIPKFHPYSAMLKEAPLAILVCADKQAAPLEGYWAIDCAAATENILLAVQAQGLGAVWLGVYPREERMDSIARLVGTPENIAPFALISIGHPAEQKPPADRFDEKRIHYDRW